jgi:glycosyltransferase involved in cell wall biosynthesis
MKICILIGSPFISGGTYVIFQHALHMKLVKGWEVDIVGLEAATTENTKWHPDAQKHLVFKTFEEVETERYDLVMITWWKTAFELYRVRGKKYVYFVQSIESWFYPAEEIPLRKLVDDTYTHQIPIITEASWIKRYFAQHYNTNAFLALNGIRKDIYTREGETVAPRNPAKLRVLVEGPIDVPFKNVPKTIELCKKANPDEIWLLTSSDVKEHSGVDRVFSRVPIGEVAKIYRSCDVIVKLSYIEGMFGPPLEMFHCGGTAIVYNVTGHDEYIVTGVNSIVLNRDDEKGVVREIKKLAKDKALLNSLKSNAMLTASSWPNWHKSSEHFCNCILELHYSDDIQTNYESICAGLKKDFENYVTEENIRLANQNKSEKNNSNKDNPSVSWFNKIRIKMSSK